MIKSLLMLLKLSRSTTSVSSVLLLLPMKLVLKVRNNKNWKILGKSRINPAIIIFPPSPHKNYKSYLLNTINFFRIQTQEDVEVS